MYSEQIEELIKSIIADGVITKKERSVLHKRAAAEGIDEDEIDVYIEGLMSQMKSDTSQSEVHKRAKIDFNFVTKLNGEHDTICYHGNNYYSVINPLNGLIDRVYLYFFQETNKEETRYGIALAFIQRKDNEINSEPKFLLDTDTISIGGDLCYLYRSLIIPPSIINNYQRDHIYAFFFDEKILKTLCDAERITISITDLIASLPYKSINDFNSFDVKYLKDISVDGLSTYAKVFYRSVVDNSAYPDALITKTELLGDNLDSTQAINIIYSDLKQLKKVPSNVSCYKQYIEPKTQAIHTFIKNGILFTKKRLKVKGEKEIDYSFSLGLHALTEKDGVITYFFELISKYTGENNRYFGLNKGRLKVSVGLGNYELSPLETDEIVVRTKKKEQCFYMIDGNLIKQLAESKKFEMSAIGNYKNNKKEVSFKNGGFGLKSSLSFSNNWKKAIELLENGGQ